MARTRQKRSAQQVLLYVLDQILRLMHPFMPFITEEIWQAIPHEGEALIIAAWPKFREDLCFRRRRMAWRASCRPSAPCATAAPR